MKTAIACCANDILWLWNDLIKEAEASERPMWHKIDARQAYQDSLNSMKANGLIEDYDVVSIRVKIDGEWRKDRRSLHFIQTGPEIDVT